MARLRITVRVDSMPPFDGERYWRWEVYREQRDEHGPDRIVFAMGWARTKRDALRIARFARQEIDRVRG